MINGLKWVKLDKYCEMSGDTRKAVHAKRNRQIWIEGQQWKKAQDGRIYINVQAVESWIENQHLSSLAA